MSDPPLLRQQRMARDVAAQATMALRNALLGHAPGLAAPETVAPVDPLDLPRRALEILGRQTTTTTPTDPAFLPLQRRTLADGTACNLPIRYFDARCLIASFPVPAQRTEPVLAGTGLRAVVGRDGMATALYGCFEYRDSDLGPYNEVGLSILAETPNKATTALYVANLPVTTALTDCAGCEIWGYNKFVATIRIEGDASRFKTTLDDGSHETIAVLEGGMGASSPTPPVDLPTFSILHGQLLETRIQPLTPFRSGSGAGFRLRLGGSSHPMAGNLRSLGLAGASPAQVQYGEPFQAFLFPGRPVRTATAGAAKQDD